MGLVAPLSSVVTVVLVVEDPGLARRIGDVAEHTVHAAQLLDPLELVDLLSERSYDVVVLDEDVLAGRGGVVLARVLRAHVEHQHVGIVLRSAGHSDAGAVVDAVVPEEASAAELYRAIREAARLCRERRTARA